VQAGSRPSCSSTTLQIFFNSLVAAVVEVVLVAVRLITLKILPEKAAKNEIGIVKILKKNISRIIVVVVIFEI
jgi:hypothetical protein